VLKREVLKTGSMERHRFIWISIVVFTMSIIFSTAIVQAMVGVLALLWIWNAVATKSVNFKSTPLDVPFLAFLGTRVLSILFSTNFRTSSVALHVEIVFYVVFFLMTQFVDISSVKRVQRIIKSLFVAAALASIIGVTKYAFGVVPRASSTTSGYYTLGNYLVVVFAIAVLLGKSKDFFLHRWMWALFCTVLGVGIILTFNRLHWIAMAIVVLFVGIVKERWLIAVFAVGAGASVVLLPDVASRFSDLLHLISRSSDRDVLWKAAFMIGDQHPVLGFGPRTFGEIFPLRDQLADAGVGSWHNDYLQIYMESGLLGVCSLLWLLGSTFYFGVRTLKSHLLPEHLRVVLTGLLAAVAVLAVVGGMLDLLVSLLFRIILALIALIVVAYQHERPTNAIIA